MVCRGVIQALTAAAVIFATAVSAGPSMGSGLSNELKDTISRGYVEAGRLIKTGRLDEALRVLDQVIEQDWDAIDARGKELDAAYAAQDALTLDVLNDVLEYDYYVSALLGLKCQVELVLQDSPYTHNQASCRKELWSFVFSEYANLIAQGLVANDLEESRAAYTAAWDAKRSLLDPDTWGLDKRSSYDFFRRWRERTRGDRSLSSRWATGFTGGTFFIEGIHLGILKTSYADAEDLNCLAFARLLSTAHNLRRNRDKYFLAEDSFVRSRNCRSPYWRPEYTEQLQTGLLLESVLRVDSLNDGMGKVGFDELPRVLSALRQQNDVSEPLFEPDDGACAGLAPVAGGGGVHLEDFWQNGFLTDSERACLQASLESMTECEAVDAFACYLRRYAVWPGVGVD